MIRFFTLRVNVRYFGWCRLHLRPPPHVQVLDGADGSDDGFIDEPGFIRCERVRVRVRVRVKLRAMSEGEG